MQHDRRASNTTNRRKACGTNLLQSEDGGELATCNDASPSAIADAHSSDEQSVNLREKAVIVREEAIEERESDLHRREGLLELQRGKLSALRVQEISDAQILKATREDYQSKLQQANENLIIASIESQIKVEEIEKSKVELAHLANHDFLTNLPNRIQLHERISQAIAFAKRHKEKLAVLFLDLDRFKIVNDTLGHAIGDQLLQAVAQRLQSALRSSDTVSRQGGDEFILLLSEVSQEKTLALNVEKIHALVTAPYTIAGNELVIGATIGISIFPQDGADAEALIRNADAAMYYAKENGRNKYQFYMHEIRAGDVERRQIEAGLYQALNQQQFVLFYQAQINLESGAITGAEALIRWRHPSRGLLLPMCFMTIAEQCGAIIPIGRWVLHEACRQAQAWLHTGLALDVIAVNISAPEFESENFVEHVRSVLQDTGLAPDRLELELTETVLMKNLESTALTLNTLRSMGVKISIDDFGAGYSSLSYLKRLPVDRMKIDRSFVNDISREDDDILLNAVIGIGKSLHHQVIAEGVETSQQLAFLRENHCPAAQGFYLHAPMIGEEFAAFLKQGVAAPRQIV